MFGWYSAHAVHITAPFSRLFCWDWFVWLFIVFSQKNHSFFPCQTNPIFSSIRQEKGMLDFSLWKKLMSQWHPSSRFDKFKFVWLGGEERRREAHVNSSSNTDLETADTHVRAAPGPAPLFRQTGLTSTQPCDLVTLLLSVCLLWRRGLWTSPTQPD